MINCFSDTGTSTDISVNSDTGTSTDVSTSAGGLPGSFCLNDSDCKSSEICIGGECVSTKICPELGSCPEGFIEVLAHEAVDVRGKPNQRGNYQCPKLLCHPPGIPTGCNGCNQDCYTTRSSAIRQGVIQAIQCPEGYAPKRYKRDDPNNKKCYITGCEKQINDPSHIKTDIICPKSANKDLINIKICRTEDNDGITSLNCTCEQIRISKTADNVIDFKGVIDTIDKLNIENEEEYFQTLASTINYFGEDDTIDINLRFLSYKSNLFADSDRNRFLRLISSFPGTIIVDEYSLDRETAIELVSLNAKALIFTNLGTEGLIELIPRIAMILSAFKGNLYFLQPDALTSRNINGFMKQEGILSFHSIRSDVEATQAITFALSNSCHIMFTNIDFVTDPLIEILKNKTDNIVEIDGRIGLEFEQAGMTERLREINPKCKLSLPCYTHLTQDLARSLVETLTDPEAELYLDRVEWISPDIAAILSEFKGCKLSLTGLKGWSEYVQKTLLKYEREQ